MSTNEYLAECEAKANEAVEIAGKANCGDVSVDAPYDRLALVLFACDKPGQPILAEFTDRQNCNEVAAFVEHACNAAPDLAARVLQLVAMVRERDKQIATLNQEPATFRCDNCRLYMSEEQEKCPNCGARQDGE